MKQTSRKFKVGSVVVGTGVLFTGLVFFILGSSVHSKLVPYSILFTESVKGMVIGSKVNFQGIPVGAVTDIRFEQGRTRVQIEIDPDKAEVQDVTFARMDRLMITGQVTVELEGYRAGGRALESGGVIPPRKSMFDEFAQSLPEVLADVDELLVSLKDLSDRLAATLDADNRDAIRRTLANFDRASAVFADQLGPLLTDGVRPALASMQANFARLGAIADRDDLRAALDGVGRAAASAGRIEAELLALVQEVRGLVGGSRRDVIGALALARDTLAEIKVLARNLRMAPASLMFGRSEHEIAVPATPAGGRR